MCTGLQHHMAGTKNQYCFELNACMQVMATQTYSNKAEEQHQYHYHHTHTQLYGIAIAWKSVSMHHIVWPLTERQQGFVIHADDHARVHHCHSCNNSLFDKRMSGDTASGSSEHIASTFRLVTS